MGFYTALRPMLLCFSQICGGHKYLLYTCYDKQMHWIHIAPDTFGYVGTFFMSIRLIPLLSRVWFPIYNHDDNDGYNLLDNSSSEPQLRPARCFGNGRGKVMCIVIVEGLTCVCFMIYGTMIRAFPVLLASIIIYFWCLLKSILDIKRIHHANDFEESSVCDEYESQDLP